jgi:hypothetical protein
MVRQDVHPLDLAVAKKKDDRASLRCRMQGRVGPKFQASLHDFTDR